MDETKKWTVRPPEPDDTPTAVLPANDHLDTEPIEVISDTKQLPSVGLPTSIYEDLKKAFVDAIHELRPVLVEIVVEALQQSRAIDKTHEEPTIEYREHYQKAKFVFKIIPYVGAIAIISLVIALVSGHALATSIALISVWAIGLASRRVIFKRASTATERIRRLIKFGWVIGVAVVALVVGLVLATRGVIPALMLVYAIVCIVVLYFIGREYFKWSELWLFRADVFIKEERPESNVYFLKVHNIALPLQRLEGAEVRTSWIEGRLRLGRVFLDVTGKKDDRYWNNRFFIVDPLRLVNAAIQGSKQATGN